MGRVIDEENWKAVEELQEAIKVMEEKLAALAKRAEETTESIEAYIRRMYGEGQEDEPRWIPCSERLPEPCQMVLATNKYGFVWVFKRIENGWSEPIEGWFTDKEEPDHVKAWMPLPEPYKEARG